MFFPVLTPSSCEGLTCSLCGKKFPRRGRLTKHTKNAHLGANPFECGRCPQTFINIEDLKSHFAIHRVHTCSICTKSFKTKSSLMTHLLTHTEDSLCTCNICGKEFIRQGRLLRHMKIEHRDELEEMPLEGERKILHQKLLQVAAGVSLVEGLDGREKLDDNGLAEAVNELLPLLVDKATLRTLGWPEAGIETLLEAVIRRCGHEPAPTSTPRPERLRHNIKLLFTIAIDDSTVRALLNNQIDEDINY